MVWREHKHRFLAGMRRHHWFMTQHSFFFPFFFFNRQCYRSVWPMRKKPRILWHQFLFASESFTWITTGNPSGRPPRWLIRIFFTSPYRSNCKSYGCPALAFCLQALSWYSSIFLCNQREPLGICFSPSPFVILHIASDVKYRSDHVKQQKKKKTYHESGDVYEIKQSKKKKVLFSFDATFISKHAGRNREEVETWCKTGCSCLCRVSTEGRELHTQALTRQLFLFFPNRAELWAARHETEQHNLMLYSNKKP